MSEMTEYQVFYFAWVRETAGADEETYALPASATGEDLKAALLERHPAFAERADHLRLAIDQAHAPWSSSLADAKELAIFPPVTGG